MKTGSYNRRARRCRPGRCSSALAACSALLLLACSGSGDAAALETASPRRSVLLICLDTVRADHLGFMGYSTRDTTPALDALAERSIVFEDVTAAACWTKPSVPSFMTGSFPATHGVYEGSSKAAQGHETDVLDEEAVTLAEAFREAGHATAGFLRNGQLAPGFGMEQGFETYENGPHDSRALVDQALAWLEQRDDDQPFFLYLHVLDAHWPFDVPDEALAVFARDEDIDLIRGSGREETSDWHALVDSIHDGERVLTQAEQDGILAVYDASLRYVDDQLARLFAALAESGELDEMVVGVVADHGEEFLEHGRYGHGHGLYENLTRVGWMLHAPGLAPGHRSQPVSLIDLHPSVLSAAGVSPSAELLAVDRIRFPNRPATLFAEHKSPSHYEQSLRQGRWKLVRSFRSSVAPLPTDALSQGTRWEAEVVVLADGALHATQLKLRDEPPGDPLELRGALTLSTSGEPSVVGIPLDLSQETEIYGAADEFSALVPDVLVKAVGQLEDGRLRVARVKVYAPGEATIPEVRGPFTHWDADSSSTPGGTVWIGPVPVTLDADTRFKNVPESPRMAREDVRRVLELGAEGSRAAGYSVEFRLFDLSSDPAEQRPVETATALAKASPEVRALSETLDRIAASAGGRSHWADRGAGWLDPELLEELRALGYVR